MNPRSQLCGWYVFLVCEFLMELNDLLSKFLDNLKVRAMHLGRVSILPFLRASVPWFLKRSITWAQASSTDYVSNEGLLKVIAWGEREGVGGIGSLGSTDANYCSWNGFTVRSCCVALKTMSRYLQPSTIVGEKLCIHVCVTGSPCRKWGKKKFVGEITLKIKLKNKNKKYIR